MLVCNYVMYRYRNLTFDEIHLCGLKFSTTVNDNIINILKYQYMGAVYLVTLSIAMGQIPHSTEHILVHKEFQLMNTSHSEYKA